ncbi:MAG TPA: uracil-DNA glycosylase [Pyrinomonadaceae bacterium]|jgi:DNA polymerase
MGTDSDLKQDLRELIKDTGEYLLYLRELGVAGIEDSSAITVEGAGAPASSTQRPQVEQEARPPALSGALGRNAEAAAAATTKAQAQTPPAPAQTGGASQPDSKQSDMARRTTKRPAELEPPPPQETLFGEVTPRDEASLPRPGETLEDIWNDIGECVRCPLHATRTHIVNSEVHQGARLLFVGEAPGADEDMQARPFVGRAGQLLNKIIEAIGLRREQVMIGNVNRCRPPQNRTPTLSEAATCKPFLLREIAVVKPEVIVVMGNTAMKNLLDTKEGITKLRGKFQDYNGIKVMPTFHPAYLLRDPSKKRETWEDMKKVRDYLDGKLTA